MLKNFQKLLKNPVASSILILMIILSIIIWYKYSAIDYVAANYQSRFYAYFDTFLSWCAIILLPLMLSGIVYRSMLFGIRDWSERPSGFLWLMWWVFSVFITGASCCGITLISVLGLTSVIGFLEIFPYHGIELKILGVLMLLYSVYDLYSHLEVCKTPRRQRSPKKLSPQKG